MSKQETDENIVGWWRKTADENDELAKLLEERAHEMFNLDDAGFMLREVKLLREQAKRFDAEFMLREAKLLREQAKRFRDAAASWKVGDLRPKRAWCLMKAAEVEPEEFMITVVNDAFTQYKALRPKAEGLSKSDVRRKLGRWGLAVTEIDARIQHAVKYSKGAIAKAPGTRSMSDIPRVDIGDPLKNARNTQAADIAKQEADEHIFGWWRQTADENDGRAKHLEELAYEMFNLDDAGFMLKEVKLLREQAERFMYRAHNAGAGLLA
jgi:hypothetical protein